MSIAEKQMTIADNVAKVYDAGKNSEYDAFWDAFQKKGESNSYLCGFSGEGWTVNTFKPKYDISVGYGYMTFRNSRIQADLVSLCNDLGITITFDKSTDFTQTFANSRFIRIGTVDTNSASAMASTFSGCTYLKKLDKLVLKSNASQTFTATFSNCTSLEDIEIEGAIGNNISFSNSPLNAKSIVSVAKALSQSASGKSAAFSMEAVNAANWEETEYDSWDALVASKPNWTFTLS